jgi:FkbM family methyltransferase
MSKRYGGPLGWLRQWNYRRVEKRRWRRDLLETLADDDAAIMEALSRLLEQGRAAAEARALAEGQAGLSGLEQRLEAIAADLGAQLEPGLAELHRSLGDRVAALEASLREQAARHERLAADRVLGLKASLAERIAGADTFPLLPTAREGLLEPELEVLAHLAPALTPKLALDVGAHHGRFTGALLDLGFEVHALEPNPAARAELERRLGGRAGLTVHAAAAGAEEGQADLGLVADPSGQYSDPTQFASLSGLPLPAGLVNAGTVRVPVRRLDVLVRERGLPAPSVVKVDAEGYDLAVLRGLGELAPAVLLVEFWDEALPFSAAGAQNRLPDLVAHARAHGAPWHLVIFRRWGDDRPAFFASWAASPERSWGNVLFFRDQALFERARQHLATLVPEARFVVQPKA